MEKTYEIVSAIVPEFDQKRFYLIDQDLNFVPEVRWLVDHKATTRRVSSPNTLYATCNSLRWYYRFLNDQQKMVLEVGPADLIEFTLWLQHPLRQAGKCPLQVSTIRQIQSAVSELYKFLVRRGYLAESPVVYEDIPAFWHGSREHDLLAHVNRSHAPQRMEMMLKLPKTRVKTVSNDDFQCFLEAVCGGNLQGRLSPSQRRNSLMVLMLKETGLRRGELLGLHMADIDFAATGVHVRFRGDNVNGARAKAGYGRDRFVMCPPEIFALLDTYISEVWVEAPGCSDYLWLTFQKHRTDRIGASIFGKPLTQTAFNKMFAAASEKSGVHVHPHMLRHTHATDLVRTHVRQGKTVDWKFISERLGHTNVATTMQTYVHLTQEDRKKAYTLYVDRREAAYDKKQ